MTSSWIDVSVPLKTAWSTGPAILRLVSAHALDMGSGDPCTVSLLEMGAHTGTHMDAPAHFVRGGPGIDALPLDTAIGSARVIAIRDPESIKPEELAASSPPARRTDPVQDPQLRSLLGYGQLRRGFCLYLVDSGPVPRRAAGPAGRHRLPLRRRLSCRRPGNTPGLAPGRYLDHRGAQPNGGETGKG